MKTSTILLLMFCITPCWSTYSTECSSSQLKEIKRITERLNQNQDGLDFEQDLEDIKLHIAYRTSLGKNCEWNDDLEFWFQEELNRMDTYVKARKERLDGIQKQWREKSQKELGSKWDKIQEKLDKFYYAGISNRKVKEFDVSDLSEQEKAIYVDKLRERLSDPKRQVDLVYSTEGVFLYQQSVTMGFYQIDAKNNGSIGNSLVKVRTPDLSGDSDALLQKIGELHTLSVEAIKNRASSISWKNPSLQFEQNFSEQLAASEILKQEKKLKAESFIEQERQDLLLAAFGGMENLEKQKQALIDLENFKASHPDLYNHLQKMQDVYDQYQQDAFIKLKIVQNQPRNVAFLIDYSGSVDGVPLDTIKTEMNLILQLLPIGSIISVYGMSIADDDESSIIMENKVVQEENRASLYDIISSHPGSGGDDRLLTSLKLAIKNTAAEEIYILSDTAYAEVLAGPNGYYRRVWDTWKNYESKEALRLHLEKSHTLQVSIYNFGSKKNVQPEIDNAVIAMGSQPGEIRNSFGNYDPRKAANALKKVQQIVKLHGLELKEYGELTSKIDPRFINSEKVIEQLLQLKEMGVSAFVSNYIDKYVADIRALKK